VISKYSNVNAGSLLNAANTALNELNSHNMSNIKKTLFENTVLKSGATMPVSNAFDEVITNTSKSGSVATLKKELNNLAKIAENISTIQRYETNINKLEQGLTYYETEYYKDEDGNDVSRQVERINYKVAAQIEELKSQIVVLENQIVDASRIMPSV